MKRTAALLIASTLALPAFATDNVCWDRDVERLDTFGNPPSRGDNNFFTFTVSGTANVTMLYPGTQTMRRFPVSLYEVWTNSNNGYAAVSAGSGRGCQSGTLNNAPYFMPGNATAPAAPSTLAGTTYSAAKSYPEPETSYSGGGGLADNFETSGNKCSTTNTSTDPTSNNCPTDNTAGHAWEFMLWPANDSGTMHNGSTGATCTTYGSSCGTINDECAAAVGCTTGLLGSCLLNVDYADCQKCAKSRGYWLNYNKLSANANYTGSDAMVAKGNWLNFYPPKWALLRLAYKRLVNGPLLNPLREGIVTQCTGAMGCNGSYYNGVTSSDVAHAAGEYRLQKMLPQSCNGAGRPSQRISSVDPVKYNATANPLAEMLWQVGWTVSADSNGSPPSTWLMPDGGAFGVQAASTSLQSTHPSGETGVSGQINSKDGFCPGCNSGFSVMFTDGRSLDGIYACDSTNPAYGGASFFSSKAPAYCYNSDGTIHDSHNACSGATTSTPGLGLGSEDDGNDFINPNISNAASSVLNFAAHQTSPPSGVCPNDFLDLVSGWMYQNNMYAPQSGTNLKLYAVEIGSNFNGKFNSVNAAASAGGGRATLANDFSTLENNINSVFQEIISTATSFSVAAITTVQTRGTTFAFIPRFRPLLGSQWEGRLFRFRLFNEFAAGCSTADFPDGGDSSTVKGQLNPNANYSCNDIYLTDADGGFVAEDDGGTFVLLDTSQPYTDAGWPIKSPKVAARPVWEAANIIECREQNFLSGSTSTCDDGGTPIAARKIMTLPLDAGIPSTDTPLITFNDFSDAGVATMTNYMKLSGVNSDFCQSMALATRTAYSTKEDCGRDTMRFMEGQDVLFQSNDGGLVRPNVMGDIFHSSPILVTPPAPTFLCETGIVPQCVRTLYAEDTPCVATGGSCTPGSKSAYTAYQSAKGNRDELILVGSNDGMLHAFQAGTSTGDGGYDEGTGVEVWSFIPPDMLPKLQRYVMGGSHQILVDGSPWVRDIWVDGSGSTTKDYQKQSDEFHTIAIIGERGGGRHYTALDITDTGSPDGGAGGPQYLWSWPPIGSNIELTEGESWNDTTPNPPPIGPVLIENASSGPILLKGTFGSTTVGPTRAEERWVVAISGGYDPNLVRGRAVYVLDAWTGAELYKFSRYDHNGTCDPASFPECALGPVAAPISLIDTNFDNFFDVAVFGDTEGNVFTIDMIKPGGTLASPNWFGGLTFKQKPGASGSSKLSDRSPFFTMPGARVFDDIKGGPRIYMGAGDRDQIRVRDTDTADGGTCQVDNLRGCIRNGCSVDVNQQTFSIGGSTPQSFTGEWKVASAGTAFATNTFTTSGTEGSVTCQNPAQEKVTYTVTCPGSTTMNDPISGSSPVNNTVNCDFDGGSDAGEECLDTSGKPIGTSVAFAQQTLVNSRFYSIELFDATGGYPATGRGRLISTTAATTYNSHPLDDTMLKNADSLDAGMDGGWYVVQSNDSNEKTASSALLLGGCVAWNTLVPNNTATDGGQTCGSGFIPASTAYLYQANDDTGGIQCGLPGSNTQLATVRFQQRTVAETVPQQPTPVVSLNAKTGQAGYSGVSLEPGGKIPLQVSVGAASVQGDVAWIDVSRSLHACRHPILPDGGATTPNCAQ